jgi:predicted RND superfamily exporter protein
VSAASADRPAYEIDVTARRPFRSLATVNRPAFAATDGRQVLVDEERAFTVDEPIRAGETYTTLTYGGVSPTSAAVASDGDYPAEIEARYTQLPEDTPDRLGDRTAAITADARAVADRYRGDATATGQIVVFQAVSETIFDSAIVSLAAALGLSALLLVVLFRLFLGSPTLGLVTLLPVGVTVAALTATMRLAGIPFNALTATILAITIGLGVDYTVHVAHRFHDEYAASGDPDAAVATTLRGTGGALTGTMATTALGTGVLVLAITPILGQFGLLTAASISLAYRTSLVVLPQALVV